MMLPEVFNTLHKAIYTVEKLLIVCLESELICHFNFTCWINSFYGLIFKIPFFNFILMLLLEPCINNFSMYLCTNTTLYLFSFAYLIIFWDPLKVLPSIKEKHGEIMLMELVKRWVNHKVMIRWLSRFFEYLSRSYLVKKLDFSSLEELGVTRFRNLVCYEFLIHHL